LGPKKKRGKKEDRPIRQTDRQTDRHPFPKEKYSTFSLVSPTDLMVLDKASTDWEKISLFNII
jgi:hypothetical protein